MQPEVTGPAWQLPLRRWHGEPLTGKRIYLWAEQGLGDTAMFASFLPYLLTQNSARVGFGVFPKTVSLFARSFPEIEVESIEDAARIALAPALLAAFPSIDNVPEQLKADYAKAAKGLFDFASPISALMQHFVDYIPAQHAAFLKADPKLIRKRNEYAVGISWFTTNAAEPWRNIPLAEWNPVLQTPGCKFYSLQHATNAQEIAAFPIDPPAFDPLQNAEALAALVASMDEVITIDNAVAHLAGALGVPTTLLLPNAENPRWPKNVPDTKWYRSVKVLRQEEAGNWQRVIERVTPNS